VTQQPARRASIPEDVEPKRRSEVPPHPSWGIEILEVLSEREMSVRQVVDEAMIPEVAQMKRSEAISRVAYHVRARRKAGSIEVVEQNQRRGTTELVCRAAVLFGAFDTRTDRHLPSVPMEVDERGRAELVELMAGMLATAAQTRHDAWERLAASGEDALRITYGRLGFFFGPVADGS
jgi:hypothetical protein